MFETTANVSSTQLNFSLHLNFKKKTSRIPTVILSIHIKFSQYLTAQQFVRNIKVTQVKLIEFEKIFSLIK